MASPFIPAKKLNENFLSVVLQRKAKDKEIAKSLLTVSTQAWRSRDNLVLHIS